MNALQKLSKSKSKGQMRIQRSASEQTGAGTANAGVSGFYSAGPVLSLGGIQAKLAVGQANDTYEREADGVADHVASGGVVRRMVITPLTTGSLTQRSPLDQQQEEGTAQRQPEQTEETVQAQSIPEQQDEPAPQRSGKEDKELPVQRMAEQENEPVQTKCGCDEKEQKQGIMPVQRQEEEGAGEQQASQGGESEQGVAGEGTDQGSQGHQSEQEGDEAPAGKQEGGQEQEGTEFGAGAGEAAGQEESGGEHAGEAGQQEGTEAGTDGGEAAGQEESGGEHAGEAGQTERTEAGTGGGEAAEQEESGGEQTEEAGQQQVEQGGEGAVQSLPTDEQKPDPAPKKPVEVQPLFLQRQADEREEPVQSLSLQRQEQTEEEPVQQKLIQRQKEDSAEEPVQMKTSSLAEHDQSMTATAARLIHNRGPGQPLASSIRHTMEPTLGADLSGVRIHTDSSAHLAASALKARAFTNKNHIWLGKGQSAHDLRLMSHELTHVVQQGAANSPVPSLGTAQGSSSPGFAVSPGGNSQGTAMRKEEDPNVIQRASVWDRARSIGGAVVSGIGSGVRAVGRFAGGVIEGAVNMGRDALMAVIRRIAPNFAEMIEQGGIVSTMRALVGNAFQSLFGGVLGRIQGAAVFRNALGMFTRAAGMFRAIAAQLATNNCSGILQVASQVGAFMSSTFGPIFRSIGRAASSISGVFRSVLTAVGLPILNILKRIGGAVWSGIQSFARMIGSMLSSVRSAVGAAWTRVKGWFGLPDDTSTGEEGGIWNWIKRKASSVWAWARDIIRPIMGPLRVVGTVLLLLSPVGPIVAAIAAWPYLRRAFGWLQRSWGNLNLIPRARAFLSNTVFPALAGAFNSVAGALQRAAGWVTGMIQQGANAILGLLQAAGGQTLLAPLRQAVVFVSNKFNQLSAWVSAGIHSAVGGIVNLFHSAVRYLQPVWGVLKRLIAIVVNPFGISGLLLGSLWKALPECLKGPIIDFIISILSRFVRAIPSSPVLGLLWPFIKSAMLGFLDRLLTFSLERKVNVSNKMANIISGGSVTFAFGYLKGLALGVWDGVIGPFLAIRDLFQLPGLISNFVSHIAERFSDLIAEARSMLATLSERVESSVESLINAARDLLANPQRILDMISTAINAALSAVGGLGASLADQMMALFEGPDSQIGEMLGKVTGSFAVQAILSFFTAGGAGAASAISRIAGILARIGSKIMPVLRNLVSYFPRVLGFVKKIGNLFARAKSSAGQMLQRIRAFFQRIFDRLRSMVRSARERIGRGIKNIKRRFRRGPRNSGERTGSSAARTLALRIARGITAINDARNTPIGILIGQLMLLKLRFPWIHRFEARPKGLAGHFSIHMIASDIDIDDDYTPGAESDWLRKKMARLKRQERRYRQSRQAAGQTVPPKRLRIRGKPRAQDTRLQESIENLYKAHGRKYQVGAGSTADAIRLELRTGRAVTGRSRFAIGGHTQKGKDYINNLRRLLADTDSPLSQADRRLAQKIIQDLELAIAGH